MAVPSPWFFDKAHISKRLAQLGVIYFSFASFYGPAQANQGFLIIIFALFIGWHINGRQLIQDPLFITSLLFIIYVVIRGVAAASSIPLERDHILGDTAHWTMLGLLPALFVAVAIRISRFSPIHIIGLAIAGFFLRIAMRIDWAHFKAYFERFFTEQYARATFGYSWINLPLWALFFVIGMIIYSDNFVQSRSKTTALLKSVVFLVTINLLFFIIIISKTRSVWILTGVIVPICMFFKLFQFRKYLKKLVVVFITLALCIPGYFLFTHYDFFKARLTAEREVVQNLIHKDVQDIPPTSIGERFYMYKAFWDIAPEKPLFGWGPGQTRKLIEKSRYPGLDDVPHFHNIFIEVFLQLGLIGFCLYLAMFVTLFKKTLCLQNTNPESVKLKWFLLCSAFIFCATGLINHTLWSRATPYFFTMVAGMAYVPLAARYMKDSQTANDFEASP